MKKINLILLPFVLLSLSSCFKDEVFNYDEVITMEKFLEDSVLYKTYFYQIPFEERTRSDHWPYGAYTDYYDTNGSVKNYLSSMNKKDDGIFRFKKETDSFVSDDVKITRNSIDCTYPDYWLHSNKYELIIRKGAKRENSSYTDHDFIFLRYIKKSNYFRVFSLDHEVKENLCKLIDEEMYDSDGNTHVARFL